MALDSGRAAGRLAVLGPTGSVAMLLQVDGAGVGGMGPAQGAAVGLAGLVGAEAALAGVVGHM